MTDSREYPETAIARWMVNLIEEEGRLYQSQAARRIKEQFGEDFVYRNENGNLAINKDILEEFKCLTERDVVWSYGGRY